jgi:hypothetical protein
MAFSPEGSRAALAERRRPALRAAAVNETKILFLSQYGTYILFWMAR